MVSQSSLQPRSHVLQLLVGLAQQPGEQQLSESLWACNNPPTTKRIKRKRTVQATSFFVTVRTILKQMCVFFFFAFLLSVDMNPRGK